MQNLLRGLLQRLRNDERGNVFVLFGATAIPLLLLMGGAVDFARYTRYKTDLANAVDAAALALARRGSSLTELQADAFVTNYVTSFYTGDNKFSVQDFQVDKLEDGFLVSATGSMQTLFLPLGKLAKNGNGISGMGVNVVSEVVNASNRLEVALVLDVTGSMNCITSVNLTCANDWAVPDTGARILGLKTAAKSLLDTLMKDEILTSTDVNQVRVAIVPFEGNVNTGYTSSPSTTPAWATPPSWISWVDNTSTAPYEGWNFDPPSGSLKISHRELFRDKLRVAWGGCVEMRSGSAYELTDATPVSGTPASLYVPSFWPDEPDSPTTAGGSSNNRFNSDSNGSASGGTVYTYQNDYLSDLNAYSTPAAAQKALAKYNKAWNPGPTWWTNVGGVNRKDTTANPYEWGPNRGCPPPIIPLSNTSNRETMKTAIENMKAFYAVGTYIPAGLIWGWHVLTPNEPFTQAIGPSNPDYPDTVRAIVLLTDGDNNVGPEDNHNKSRYGAYSYVLPGFGSPVTYRLGNGSTAADAALDANTATLCGRIKTNNTTSNTADDIRVYTISFGPALTGATKTMIENCATLVDGQRLYWHAPTNTELQTIFDEIGKDLNKIHLSM